METAFTPLSGLAGGALIGAAAVVLMAGLGRIAGLSGILAGAVLPGGDGRPWQLAMILAIPAGAWLAGALGLADPTALHFVPHTWMIAAAGLIVGVGVTWGAGCTSGHGICGLASLSPRSLAATVTFMATAALTVYAVRHVFGA